MTDKNSKKTLKLCNTLSRGKQKFEPINPPEVGIYECGPTVYWYQHVGNLRRYIFGDILTRILKYNNYNVKRVMNVTDVGHLTSDDDTGDDKIEIAAKKEKKKAKDIAEFYLKKFKEDFEKLNILDPDTWCKATEHIKEMIELIKILEEKGYTYETSDGIYFDTSKIEKYGELTNLDSEDMEAGKRVDMKEKKNKTDFALWKFSEEKGKRQQEWDPKDFGAEWKIGYPGWHIECSAMSSKYLGKQYDIHTGGEDNAPIHHNNEIAQSEAAFCVRPWVKYWLHSAFLTSGNKKVSKSEGGLFTVEELEKKGFDPLSFRYFVLNGHYRKQLAFSIDTLKQAQNTYKRLKNKLREIEDDGEENKEYLDKFEEAINNDLNTPKALAILWDLLRDDQAKGKLKTVKIMDKVFGLNLDEEEIKIPKDVEELAEKREIERKDGNYEEADKIREKIKNLGFYVNDTPEGPKIKKYENE